MDLDPVRQAFAARVNELCDELGIEPGRGRQTALGKRFGVTPKGVRKWLLGIAYPEMPLAVAMCQAAGVNVLWLLQGSGPKHGDQIDPRLLHVAQALESMPKQQRDAVLDFMKYQVTQTGQWFAAEALRHFVDDIDALRAGTQAPPGKQVNAAN
jgi:transcriptional regulator with XRE-family HTH domain